MIKAFKGICTCHQKENWILNKKGECQRGINERTGKKINKTPAIQRKSVVWSHTSILKKHILRNKKPIAKKVKKATGEAIAFRIIWEEACEKAFPESPLCRVCQASLGNEAKTYYFSHVLAKGNFPAFRLVRRNIWLCCMECHVGWDHGDRSAAKYSTKRVEALELKKLYYQTQKI